MTKFPVTTKRASNKRALQTTISSARDRKSICAGDESEVRLLLLLDLMVVDIFFILVRIESVFVVGCNLFITQKIWKIVSRKRLARVSAECMMYLISGFVQRIYRLSQSRSHGFLVWCGRTWHERRAFLSRASRSLSRYGLKSSTCEQV